MDYLFRETHSSLPIWVKIFNIHFEEWNEEGIAIVTSTLRHFLLECVLRWMSLLLFPSLLLWIKAWMKIQESLNS